MDAEGHARPEKVLAAGRNAEFLALDAGRVLKRFRDGCSLERIEREARLGALLHAAGLPVPAVLDLWRKGGQTGIVFERLHGPTLMAELMQGRWTPAQGGTELGRLHRRILGAPLRPSGPELPAQRQKLLRHIAQAPGLDDAQRQVVLRRLAALPDGEALCHGDFHPGNILLTLQGPRVVDWENADRGHPAADAARAVLLFRLAEIRVPVASGEPVPPAMRKAFEQHYLAALAAGDASTTVGAPAVDAALVDAWLLPMAAVRLHDAIPEERAPLLDLVRERLVHS